MADSTVALFSALAVKRFARYLEGDDWRDAALFGIWASAAILTKYNGLALTFVPPLCAVFTRRWNLLWRTPTIVSAAIVLVMCGSWYLPMWRLIAYAAEPLPRLATVFPAMKANTSAMAGALGIPMLLVAGIGVVVAFGRPPRRGERGIWTSAAAVIAGWWIFHSITVPDPEPRYILAVLPWLILFVAAGIECVAARLRCRPVLVACGLGIAYAAGTFTLVRTVHIGYAEVASAIISQRDPGRAVILANGGPEHEGMAVAAIATREQRPGHYVLRGSKVLAKSTWMGAKYRSLYRTPAEVLQALDAVGVSTVILQADARSELPHNRLLVQALRSAPQTWKRWSDAAWHGYEQHIQVYQRIHAIRGPFCLELSLEETLHRRLAICIPSR